MRHTALVAAGIIVYRRFTMMRQDNDHDEASSGAGDGAESVHMASVMAALGHPARVTILRRLACCDECCCREVVEHLNLAQSTVSQHLKVLVEAGLVSYEPRRPKSRYVLNRQALQSVSSAISDLVNDCCSQQPSANS
ncbi:MAG: metalloregulator ArsR/SmtB family transcription factor [Anderseniella sp.]